MSGNLTCTNNNGTETVKASVKALKDFKNPYSTSNPAVTNGGNTSSDSDVGYVRMTASGNTITIGTCFATACSKTENVTTNTVQVE